jgi:hypothetical protein
VWWARIHTEKNRGKAKQMEIAVRGERKQRERLFIQYSKDSIYNTATWGMLPQVQFFSTQSAFLLWQPKGPGHLNCNRDTLLPRNSTMRRTDAPAILMAWGATKGEP